MSTKSNLQVMAELLNVFSQRLRQARILKKISMDQLVSMIGNSVSKQAISKYEAGKMMPNSTVLTALATALDVEPDYFFRPFTFDLNEFKVSFRKKSNTSAKDVNALKVQIQDEVERYLEVEKILGKEKEVNQPSHIDQKERAPKNPDLSFCQSAHQKSTLFFPARSMAPLIIVITPSTTPVTIRMIPVTRLITPALFIVL